MSEMPRRHRFRRRWRFPDHVVKIRNFADLNAKERA